MRQECKNFESRTYANGETVRKCNSTWRPMPVAVPGQLQGVRAAYGCRVDVRVVGLPADPTRAAGLDDGSAAAILDEAEDFLNSIGPQVMSESGIEGPATRKKGFRRLMRRFRDS
jgi:hypothetical protein